MGGTICFVVFCCFFFICYCFVNHIFLQISYDDIPLMKPHRNDNELLIIVSCAVIFCSM